MSWNGTTLTWFPNVMRTEEQRLKHNAHARDWMREQRKKHPIKVMIKRTRHRAKRLGIEFNISEKDITIPDVCPILGIPLIVNTGRYGANSPSLDRIDNKKGYIPGNVAVISQKANLYKSDMTIDQILALGMYVLKAL